MRRNWVAKLLVVCNALSALGFLYGAYHTATLLLSFPDSWLARWFARYREVFPGLGVIPAALFHLTGKPLFTITDGARLPAVLFDVLLAVASGVLTFALARYWKWARTTFGILAASSALFELLKFTPVLLHLFVGGLRNYLTGLASERIGPQYTFFGMIVSAGCAWLMWRWRNELDIASLQAATGANTQVVASPASASQPATQARLRKSILVIRVAVVLSAIAFLLGCIPLTSVSWANATLPLAIVSVQVLVLAFIWFFLSSPEPRFGIGVATGFGALTLLPYVTIGLSPHPLGMLYLLGVQGLLPLIEVVVLAFGALIMLIFGIRAAIRAGRPATQAAGQWGAGVLLVLLGGVCTSQLTQESTYAKSPPMSPEKAAQQSEEYQRGHAAQQALRAIGKCVFQYAAAHPQEGFPAQLDQAGKSGSGCLRETAAVQVPGHMFLYTASTSSATGPRDRFTLRSKQTEHIASTYSLPDQMVDESGVVAAMDGDKRGFNFSPALALMNNIGACLKVAFDATGGETYPGSLRGLLSIKGQYGVQCIAPYEAKDLSVIDLWRNKFQYGFYDFTYAPLNESVGKYKGFRLEARPKEYGAQAFRSYFLDESGIVHATPQDRAATSADADASCEIQRKDCSLAAVPLAVAEPPK